MTTGMSICVRLNLRSRSGRIHWTRHRKMCKFVSYLAVDNLQLTGVFDLFHDREGGRLVNAGKR